MKKHLLLILIFTLLPIYLWGQSKNIKKLFEEEQYHTIVEQYGSKNKKNFTAEELSDIGWSYHILYDSKTALAYLSEAIAKEKNKKASARLYYRIGSIYLSTGDYDKAGSYLKNAIESNPEIGNFYEAMGNLYLAKDETDEAISYYKQGIEAAQPSEQAFFMLADTYDKTGLQQESLKAFYNAKKHIKEDTELYITVLYNIGTQEMANKQYKKAIAAFSELVEYAPDDYFTYTRLVQCCYALGNYEIGDTYKEPLYKAYSEGDLTESEFADKFCVDNFQVDNKLVSCYEYFQSTTDENANVVPIYIFYVINDMGMIEAEIDYGFQSYENISLYKLSLSRVDTGETDSANFSEDMDYAVLKNIIKNIVSKNYSVSTYKF
ncbi:lipopolysaccharide assembly protein LapB [Dysgonomonas sp. 25]|uniref:tetratricopeptide repeat protein n=1 Tax=Dysgonomonas sp. 25 TaxID=2302933 RepID=UPI0013D4AE45|nr:tetratricopeptide repeat protein [Dysgonomonas sp. 25]NDV68366.1 tetratricopeptide repeat protein [Dysgonomonas sp. 25]